MVRIQHTAVPTFLRRRFDSVAVASRQRIVALASLACCLVTLMASVTLLAGCRTNDRAEVIQVGGPDSKRNQKGLKLVLVGRTEQHRTDIRVTLRVSNQTETPLSFDKKSSTFVLWTVVGDDGLPLAPRYVRSIENTRDVKDKKRFAVLQPGERLDNDIELTKAVQCFETGWGTSVSREGDFVHSPTASEHVERYEIAAPSKKVTIRAEYLLDQVGRDSFWFWFGYSPTDVLLWQGHSTSNSLEVRLSE